MLYGKSTETRETLRGIPVPVREVSSRWVGVQHGELADNICRVCENSGLKISAEFWKTNDTKTDLFGAIDFDQNSPSLPEGCRASDLGLNFSMGVRHSNVGRYAVSLAVGARVVVCSNGMFTGEVLIKHRHTSSLDQERLTAEAVEQYIHKTTDVLSNVERMLSVSISEHDASNFMWELAKHPEVIGFRYLRHFHEEFMKPTYDEFKDRNAWSLYNAATTMIKEMPPVGQYKALSHLLPCMKRVIPELN